MKVFITLVDRLSIKHTEKFDVSHASNIEPKYIQLMNEKYNMSAKVANATII